MPMPIEELVRQVNGCWSGYEPSHHEGEICTVRPSEGGERLLARIVADTGITVGICRYVIVIDQCGAIRRVHSNGVAVLRDGADGDPRQLNTRWSYAKPFRARRLEPHYWDVSHLAPTFGGDHDR